MVELKKIGTPSGVSSGGSQKPRDLTHTSTPTPSGVTTVMATETVKEETAVYPEERSPQEIFRTAIDHLIAIVEDLNHQHMVKIKGKLQGALEEFNKA